jgi:hypothetical protein
MKTSKKFDITGPKRVTEFLFEQRDETIQADAFGYVRQLLRALKV